MTESLPSPNFFKRDLIRSDKQNFSTIIGRLLCLKLNGTAAKSMVGLLTAKNSNPNQGQTAGILGFGMAKCLGQNQGLTVEIHGSIMGKSSNQNQALPAQIHGYLRMER